MKNTWQILLTVPAVLGLLLISGCETDDTVPSVMDVQERSGGSDSTPPPTDPVGEGGTATADNGQWDEHTQGLDFTFGYEAGMEQAASEDKPALVFVTTTWCGFCKMLANEAFNDPSVQERMDQFVLVLVDGDTETGVTQTLGVNGYPHVIFQSPSGAKLGESIGYVPADEFAGRLDGALAEL